MERNMVMGEVEEKTGERWRGAILNLTEASSNLDSLQKLLSKKAVFVDDETYLKASLAAEQTRTIKIWMNRIRLILRQEETSWEEIATRASYSLKTWSLEKRVENLERELDAAISAAAHARSEKRKAEAAQKVAELHAQEVTKELENTTKVFKLHMEELRAKQEVISRKDGEIKVLEAIIQTVSQKEST